MAPRSKPRPIRAAKNTAAGSARNPDPHARAAGGHSFSLRDIIDALHAAGATEVTVELSGAVTARWGQVTVAVDPQQKAPPFVPSPVQVPAWPADQQQQYPLSDWLKVWWQQTAPRCAFEGLPSGAYGIVCYCPKCTPSYGGTSATSSTVDFSGPIRLRANDGHVCGPGCPCSTQTAFATIVRGED